MVSAVILGVCWAAALAVLAWRCAAALPTPWRDASLVPFVHIPGVRCVCRCVLSRPVHGSCESSVGVQAQRWQWCLWPWQGFWWLLQSRSWS